MHTELEVLLAERDAALVQSFTQALQENGIRVRCCTDGARVLPAVLENRPRLVVMDLLLPGIDGLALLRQITQLPDAPKILVVTAFVSDYIAAVLAECGVSHVLLKPCRADKLVRCVQTLLNRAEADPTTAAHVRVRRHCHDLLCQLGLNPAHAGYRYLLQAVLLALRQPETPVRVTKQIYPQLAKLCGTTPSRVERAIRFAIESAWKMPVRSGCCACMEAMGFDVQNRPTNTRFIRTLLQNVQCIKAERINQ